MYDLKCTCPTTKSRIDELTKSSFCFRPIHFKLKFGHFSGLLKRCAGHAGVTTEFPSWNRRGGCAIRKMVPFLIGADGVVI